jgi:hypothetical protein
VPQTYEAIRDPLLSWSLRYLERPINPKPLTGAYYWVPHAHQDGPTWELITCHDLKVWHGVSHREFWPHVVEQLAAAWGKDAGPLKHRLGDHHTGLPRGRINYPRPGYILLHGDDAPVTDWLSQITDRFHLRDVEVELVATEHESVDRRDLAAVEEALGVFLGLDLPVW